jgi:hypothetical protein
LEHGVNGNNHFGGKPEYHGVPRSTTKKGRVGKRFIEINNEELNSTE